MEGGKGQDTRFGSDTAEWALPNGTGVNGGSRAADMACGVDDATWQQIAAGIDAGLLGTDEMTWQTSVAVACGTEDAAWMEAADAACGSGGTDDLRRQQEGVDKACGSDPLSDGLANGWCQTGEGDDVAYYQQQPDGSWQLMAAAEAPDVGESVQQPAANDSTAAQVHSH